MRHNWHRLEWRQEHMPVMSCMYVFTLQLELLYALGSYSIEFGDFIPWLRSSLFDLRAV